MTSREYLRIAREYDRTAAQLIRRLELLDWGDPEAEDAARHLHEQIEHAEYVADEARRYATYAADLDTYDGGVP